MDFLLASGIFALVFVGVLIFTSSRGSEVEQQREVARRLTRPPDDIDIDVMRKQRPEEGALLSVLYDLICCANSKSRCGRRACICGSPTCC